MPPSYPILLLLGVIAGLGTVMLSHWDEVGGCCGGGINGVLVGVVFGTNLYFEIKSAAVLYLDGGDHCGGV